MDSKQVRKLKDKAAKYLEKNKLKKALKIYLEMLRLDSRDAALHMKTADLQRRLNREEDALRLYARAAELYAKDGMLIQGMAACKVILDIDPEHSDTQELLADLYTKKYGALPKKRSERDRAAETSSDPEKDFSPANEAFSSEGDIPVAAERGEQEDEALALEREFLGETNLSADSGEEGEQESGALDSETESLGERDVTDDDFVMDGERVDREAFVMDGERVDSEAEDSEAEEIEEELDEEIEFIFEDEIPSPTMEELPQIPLFSDLDRDSFIELLGRVPLRRHRPNERIVTEGEPGESFFVLVSGTVKVLKDPGLEIALLKPGAFFGEIALVANRPRRASVEATEHAETLEISRQELDLLEGRYPHVKVILKRFAEQRLLYNLMVTSPLFTPFSESEKRDLIKRFVPEFYPGDHDIITQGELSSGLFLIASGAVDVLQANESGQMESIAELSEGDICGELSLMTREPAVATVRTRQETRVLKLPREAFSEIIMTHPQILMLITELTDKRSWEARISLSTPLGFSEDGGSALL